MKKIKLLLTYILFVTTFFTSVVPVYAKQQNKELKEPKISAKTAIVMDVQTGQVLYNKKMNKIKYPASLTKLMTVLLAIENCELNEKVKFSVEAAYGIEPGSSSIGIMPNEILTVEQCLYGMMLESANEVCSAIAEHISGSVEEFAELMNKRAEELGCKNTHFTNANGLHNDNHYTTAYDLALILKQALSYPEFRKVASTRNSRIPKTNLNPARELWNHHKMIKYPSGTYSIAPLTVTSGKTAYTTKAKTCLSTSATNGDMELICIVMDDAGVAVYTDTKALFEYAFEKYEHAYPLQSYETMPTEDTNLIAHNFFLLLDPDRIDLFVNKDYMITIPKDADMSELTTIVTKNIDEQTKTLGTIDILYQNQKIGSTSIDYKDFTASPITVAKPETEENVKTIVDKIPKRILMIGIAFAIFFILLIFFIFYWNLSKKRRSLRFYNKKYIKKKHFD